MGKSYSGVKQLQFQHFTIPVFPKDFQFTQRLLFTKVKVGNVVIIQVLRLGYTQMAGTRSLSKALEFGNQAFCGTVNQTFVHALFLFFFFFFEQPESSAQQLMKRGGRGPIHTNHLILKIKNGTQTFKQTHCKSREMEIHGPSSSHMSGRLKPRRGPPDFHD